jgi:hypothetical protein
MSQRDNFSGGFLLGAMFGGIVGGALGAVVASRVLNPQSEEALLSAVRLILRTAGQSDDR